MSTTKRYSCEVKERGPPIHDPIDWIMDWFLSPLPVRERQSAARSSPYRVPIRIFPGCAMTGPPWVGGGPVLQGVAGGRRLRTPMPRHHLSRLSTDLGAWLACVVEGIALFGTRELEDGDFADPLRLQGRGEFQVTGREGEFGVMGRNSPASLKSLQRQLGPVSHAGVAKND